MFLGKRRIIFFFLKIYNPGRVIEGKRGSLMTKTEFESPLTAENLGGCDGAS